VVDITSSGVYDTFTITQAVSVEADLGIVATILVPSGGTGITINAGPSDTVALKRLSVRGSAGNEVGIQANAANSISIEDCVSRNLNYGASLSSNATAFKVAGGVFAGNDTSLYIRAGGNRVSIDAVKIYKTAANAAVDAVGQNITLTHSLLAGDGVGGFSPGVWIKDGSVVVLENDVISGYGNGVVLAPTGTAYLSSNTITNNSTGVFVNNASAFSRLNNTIAANSTNVNGAMQPFGGQ